MDPPYHSPHECSDAWERFRHDVLPLELDASKNYQKTYSKIRSSPLGTPGITCGSRRRDYIDTKDVEYNVHGVSYILFLISQPLSSNLWVHGHYQENVNTDRVGKGIDPDADWTRIEQSRVALPLT